MRQITLGRTKTKVSAVSLGTWSYGGKNMSGGRSVGWAGQEKLDSQKALIKAWEVGINHWDTADVYGDGRSEQVIGSIWKTVPRDEVFLATKVGWDQGYKNHWYDVETMRHNIERSLKNLKTDCVDLLYLHHCNFGKNEEYFDDAVDVLCRFQEEGKTKFTGLSDWDLEKIMKFIERANPDVVQPYRNIYKDTYLSSGLKDYIETHNLGVCYFSPLMHGLLTGKYTQPSEFSEGDFRKNIGAFKDESIINRFQKNAEQLREKFKDHPNPVMHGVIDTLVSDSKNSCVLLGQRNTGQVEVASSLGKIISDSDIKWVKSIYTN
jgi:aryl-alcohol dehydrogenase-like predicted oxidoreductase